MVKRKIIGILTFVVIIFTLPILNNTQIANPSYKTNPFLKFNPIKRLPNPEFYLKKSSLSGYKICIDPGHGGSDSGNEFNGLIEKDLSFDIAVRLRQLIVEDGGIAILTRVADEDVSNSSRKNIANSGGFPGAPANIFISIHFGYSSDPNASGIEVFHYPNSTGGIPLAKNISYQLVSALSFTNHSITPQDSYLIQVTSMPAIIIIGGCFSNFTEHAALSRSEIRQIFAESILLGIQGYFGVAQHIPKPDYYTNVVYATREGCVGDLTSNGHTIRVNDTFVALPSRLVTCADNSSFDYMVNVTYNGKNATAPVWDRGPWNVDDDYWDFERVYSSFSPVAWGVPEAQAAYINNFNGGLDQYSRTVLNPAGIDLADGTFWNNLSMVTNDWVKIEFLWMPINLLYNFIVTNDLVNGRNHSRVLFKLNFSTSYTITDEEKPSQINLIINARSNLSHAIYNIDDPLIKTIEFWRYNLNETLVQINISDQFLSVRECYSVNSSSNELILDIYQPVASIYNRTAAVLYADEYWIDYNTEDYTDYSGMGGDCANYVSQCLIAGGVNFWKGRDGNGGGVDSKGTMPYCDYLHSNLFNYQGVKYAYIENSGTPPEWLEPGDVIMYGDAGGDKWRHAVFVVEGAGDSAKINSHTNDKWHTDWDYAFGPTKCANFYHIPDKGIKELFTFEVNTPTLNVRHGPSTSYEDLGDIHQGEKYVGLETVGSWTRFWFDHRNLWCHSGYIQNVSDEILFEIKADEKVNVTYFPSLTALLIDYTYPGQKYCVKSSSQNESINWIEFNYKGIEGWIQLDFAKIIDVEIPYYDNISQNPSPLELGGNVTIQIDATDGLGSGIKTVLIEYGGQNHTMANLGGNTFYWDSWIPTNISGNSYTFYISDLANNWNKSFQYILNVQDNTAPTFSNLIEGADPLELGNNETIQITVIDDPGVGIDKVILEYESQNHTMNHQGGDLYTWKAWKPSLIGIYQYTIYMNDTEGNTNYTTGNITVQDMGGANWTDLQKVPQPLELGENITIRINVTGAGPFLVLLEYDNLNHTMINTAGDRFEWLNWKPVLVGIKAFKIFINDSNSIWVQLAEQIMVQDTIAPIFHSLFQTPEPVELGNATTIQITVLDDQGVGVETVTVEYDNSNHTMTQNGDNFTWSGWIPSKMSNNNYTIYMKDFENNWNSTEEYILNVQDTQGPTYSNIRQNPISVALGQSVVIRIVVKDYSDISAVLLEYYDQNYTMIHTGGSEYVWDEWVVNNRKNITYRFYINDTQGNWRVTSSYYLNLAPPSPSITPIFQFESEEQSILYLIIGALAATIAIIAISQIKRKSKEPSPVKPKKISKKLERYQTDQERLKKIDEDLKKVLKKTSIGKIRQPQIQKPRVKEAPKRVLSPETQKILRDEREKLFVNAELYIELEEYQKAIEIIDRIVKISQDLGDIDEKSPKLKRLLDIKKKIMGI